eukprot:TRINITY_DN28467_c0_g1_i1.p1 TRINITY_DN28467_c0_g1~~TRINITY_DN28467_c0_g1_i1.p1  ORF type:complete len:546 (+),score=72.31 TRINITY_DN28467_c0_g1_i1:152-1639(+)
MAPLSKTKAALAVALSWQNCRGYLVPGPWADVSKTPEERAAHLVKEMTLDEKLQFLHGPKSCPSAMTRECAYVGNVPGVERLGIPPITMNDGPQGFRVQGKYPSKSSTAWPSGLTMAASWDAAAVREWGVGMGKEFYAKGSNVQLGPGLCVARVPRGGRNFEYISGEDPKLGRVLAKAAVEGIQSQKVVANAKHWVLNNQEANRLEVSAEVDERTKFEIYYPPFEGAIDGKVGSFMCSYNKINGAWSCENNETFGDLKERLGFKGYVMSDWGATHSRSIMAGLDMEMPNADFMNATAVSQGLNDGSVTQRRVDDAVYRVLLPMFDVGVMDQPEGTWDWKNLQKNVSTEESAASARRLSALSTVLLKNEGGILPLPTGKRYALIGMAADNAMIAGGGSGAVVASYVVSPREGIGYAAGEDATITYQPGQDVEAAAKAPRRRKGTTGRRFPWTMAVGRARGRTSWCTGSLRPTKTPSSLPRSLEPSSCLGRRTFRPS